MECRGGTLGDEIRGFRRIWRCIEYGVTPARARAVSSACRIGVQMTNSDVRWYKRVPLEVLLCFYRVRYSVRFSYEIVPNTESRMERRITYRISEIPNTWYLVLARVGGQLCGCDNPLVGVVLSQFYVTAESESEQGF